MSDSVANEPLPSKQYDDEYVFKVPSMRFEAYKDGEFEHDERLLLTALTGRYKLKADGFHRLLAKFIMRLPKGYSSSRERVDVDVDVPPFASEFRSTKELSNQIGLNDLFDCDLNEEQLLKALPLESFVSNENLHAKNWLFAAISSLLIRSKIKNPKCQKSKYKNLCNKLYALSGKNPLFNLDKDNNPWKITINFNKFEKIMKRESDALHFAICWMVLVLENYPNSRAAHLFKFCFLQCAKHHGLVLFALWDQLTNLGSDLALENERWSRIAKNIDAVGKSLKNLNQFYLELPAKMVNGKRTVSSQRWRYCRLVDDKFFTYVGISANLKTCLAMVFVIDLFWVGKRYADFVKSREKRPGFQKLTEEEEKLLKKEHEIFQENYHRKAFSFIDYFQKKMLMAGSEKSDAN